MCLRASKIGISSESIETNSRATKAADGHSAHTTATNMTQNNAYAQVIWCQSFTHRPTGRPTCSALELRAQTSSYSVSNADTMAHLHTKYSSIGVFNSFDYLGLLELTSSTLPSDCGACQPQLSYDPHTPISPSKSSILGGIYCSRRKLLTESMQVWIAPLQETLDESTQNRPQHKLHATPCSTKI